MTRFTLTSCLLYILSFSAQAVEYHVCSNGNDSKDGLSHSTAWKTYAKAHSAFESLNGGDSILFCKGQEFVKNGTYKWGNYNSTRDNRITISSYSPPGSRGTLANPVIHATGGGSAILISDGGPADYDEGYVISHLILRGDGVDSGLRIYADAHYIDVIDVEIYDFKIGIYVTGTGLAISRSFIHDNHGQGFLGGGDNLVIEDSYFVNNGFGEAVFNHNIYLSDAGGGTFNNEIIRNNKLYQSAIVGGECKGVSLVAHGNHHNLLIENNVVWEDVDAVNQGCWGIAVDNGYVDGELFPGLIIRGNTVVNVGNMAIGCAVCQDVIIENNTVVHQSQFGARAIKVPDRAEPASASSNNITVRNNTVLYDSPGGGTGIRLGDGDGSTYTSTDNNIYYSAGSPMTCESYNSADNISVSENVCHEGIPQDMLDGALARTLELLPTPKSTITSSSGE